MDRNELKTKVVAELKRIAPEVEELQEQKPLRDQVDLDSMDWLNFLIALNERFKVEIAEADYRKLVTLDDVVGYLARKLP